MACSTCGHRKTKSAESANQPHDYVAPNGTRTTYPTRKDALQARKANAGYGRVVPSHK